MGKATRSVALIGALCAVLMLTFSDAPAAARDRAPKSIAAKTQAASRLALKIPGSRFAKRHRATVVKAAKRAVKLAKTKRSCSALAATDRFASLLGLPATWRRHKVPRGLVRKPLALLAGASRALLHRAGRRCARPAIVHKLRAHTGGSGSPKVTPPSTHPDQGQGEDHPIPLGKLIRPKSTGGGSSLAPDPHNGGLTASGDPFAHASGPTLSFFRNSDVGIPSRTGSPMEPTTAIAPGTGVAWYTGNSTVALSLESGRTFRMFDPSNVLPDQGLAFCCDQLVSYSPQYNMFVWVSQYWCNKSCLVSDNGNPPRNVCRTDGVYNRIRIAVASPQALRANATNPGAAWTYWDVTPATIGETGNAWFDRSDMSVNPYYFNWGVDILCGNGGNLLSRISLAQLAARGTVTLNYLVDGGERTTAQGMATSSTYFVGANSQSQARIWSWAPFSGTLFLHNINHSSVPIFNNAINGTDHNNWYDRYGTFPGEVESAALSGSTLYTAIGTGRAYCTAGCSTSSPTLNQAFSEPAILIAKYDVNSWTEVGERWLWNPTLAFGWPALATDGAGDVGIAFRTSADNQNPQPVAGLLTPGEQFYYADPAGQPYETGDYYSLRPGRTSQSFVMTGQTVESGAMHWFYIEYGIGQPPYVFPPSAQITSPKSLSNFLQGSTVTYSADVSDPIDGTLPSGAIVWTEDGSQIGTGPSITHVENSVGIHTIKVTATNGDGKSASDSIAIRVQAPVAPGSPSVSITSPPDGTLYCAGTNVSGTYYAQVQMQATASDPNQPPLPLTYSWSDSVDLGNPSVVSTALSPQLLLAYNTGDGETTHDLTLTVTNSANKSNTAQVRINTYNPGCIG